MPLISRLESRFGRFAPPNVTLVLIIGQVLCYLVNYGGAANGNLGILNRIPLVPELVLQGEVWRLVTYLFDPPRMNILFAFFAWYLFYLMGTTLEANWGTFRYCLYLLLGYLASLTAAFIGFAVFNVQGEYASNAFLYGSVFLAFARFYPDFTLMLMFILPVKIKWLALLTWIGYGFTFLTDPGWLSKLMILAATLNYLVFFGRDIIRNAKQGHRRMQSQAKTLQTNTKLMHECRVCGLSSKDSPRVAFRYCSQCEGQCCYCPEHIRSHQHVGE